jgi:hypothetical protein
MLDGKGTGARRRMNTLLNIAIEDEELGLEEKVQAVKEDDEEDEGGSGSAYRRLLYGPSLP